MGFDTVEWDKILPTHILKPEKESLINALEQFKDKKTDKSLNYNNFYKLTQLDYFMQGDLLFEIRFPFWLTSSASYDKRYTDAIIISNTCDISDQNDRSLNAKECLFAPLIALDVYANSLNERFDETKVKGILTAIRNQELTNIFYLPYNHNNGVEYIAMLDKAFWIETTELNSYLKTIENDRIASLSHFGFYLFVLKLSHHLCRFPKENDRAGT